MKLRIRNISLLFFVYFIFILMVFYPALNWGFVWDDYHLIRNFSVSELLSTFTGHWDTDNIETPGYRPFTAFFNFIRYNFFDENVFFHRMFLIFLYSVLSVQIFYISSIFIQNTKISFLSPFIMITAHVNYIHVVWLSDGIHIFQAVLCMFFLLFLLHKKNNISCLFMFLALFCREDSLGFILAGFFMYICLNFKRPAIYYIKIFLPFFLVIAVFIILRAIYIDTPSEKIHIIHFLKGLKAVFFTTGNVFNNSFYVLFFIITLFSFYKIFFEKQYANIFIMFICICIAVLPCIIVLRSNIFLLPSIFVSLLFSMLFITAEKKNIISFFGSFIFLMIIILNINQTRIKMQALHPNSIHVVRQDLSLLKKIQTHYSISIPEQRKAALVEKLRSLRTDKTKDVFECTIMDMNVYYPRSAMFDLQ